MFQLYLCLELSSTQTVSSHYTPSFLHILKMMMNAMVTLQSTIEYSTLLLYFLFSTPFLLMFFSTILFPPPSFVCVQSSLLPFSHTNSNNKHKLFSTITFFFSSLNISLVTFIFSFEAIKNQRDSKTMLIMYTNPKMEYRSNMNKDRQKWTETCKGKRLLMKGYNKFQNRPKASNHSTMTMFSKKIMNSKSSMVCLK